MGVRERKHSVVGERVAHRNLEYMQQLTQHVIDQESFLTSRVGPPEIRNAFAFWLSEPVRRLCQKRECPDLPLERAHALVNWLFHQFEVVAANNEAQKRELAAAIDLVLMGSNRGSSVNEGLTRLLVLYLQPMQGTRAELQDRGHRGKDTVPEHLRALLQATRVVELMERLHADNVYFPRTQPDPPSCLSILNLMGKRCKFMAFLGGREVPNNHSQEARLRRGVRWSDPETIEALGGCSTARECIVAARAYLDQMKQGARNHCNPHPGFMHYSTVLSMYSYVSKIEEGTADEAYQFLQQLERDPDFIDIALYNCVLLAYHNESAFCWRNAKFDHAIELRNKAEALFEHIQSLPDSLVSADPITYSIMMTVYQDIDEAEKAQRLLERMEQSMTPGRSVEDNIPPPTLVHYNTVLNAWSKASDRKAAADRAGELLRRMEQASPNSNIPKPDKIAYTTVLSAVLRGSSDDEMIDRIETLLDRFEANSNPRARPDDVSYNMLFQQLFQRLEEREDVSVKEIIANQMEYFLMRLQKRSRNFRHVAKAKMHHYYNDCLRAWGVTGKPSSIERAIRLLDEMEEKSRTLPSAQPNGVSYQSIFAAVVRRPNMEAVQTARKLFDRMETTGAPRTITSLNLYLGLLLKCYFEGSSDEADQKFVSLVMERFSPHIADAFTYRWVFEGIFRHLVEDINTLNKEDYARKTEKLLRTLLRDSEHFRSTEGCRLYNYYNNCLRAWAFAHSPQSTEHAVRLLQEMEEKSALHGFGNLDEAASMNFQPDTKTYEYVLTCLTRAPDKVALEYARTVFNKMDESNTPISLSVLNTFLRVLAKSKADGALQEAKTILDRVEEKFLKGTGSICPNRSSYEILYNGCVHTPHGLIDADILLDRMKEMSALTNDKKLLPTSEMYRAMMVAWATSNVPDSMEHVDDNFHKMAEHTKPNSEEYFAWQEAWHESKRKDAAQHVESILVRMQQEYDQGVNLRAKPSIKNFNIVIKSWAECKDQVSAERADAILKRLEDLYQSGNAKFLNLRPNVQSYEYALLGWSLSGSLDASERALALLDRMKENASEDSSFPLPGQACYNHVLAAISKSRMPMKSDKCYSILEEMRRGSVDGSNMFSKPTHDTFQTILQACATCTSSNEEKSAAARVLKLTMQEYVEFMQSSARADAYRQYLYGAFRLHSAGAERNEAVAAIFTNHRNPCPCSYLKQNVILDALDKTVDLDTFNFILSKCCS